MKIIRHLSDVVFKIEKGLVIILVALMFISLTTGVLSRYLIKIPLHWADETAIFSLVWLTFIGGSMSLKYGHISAVTIFVNCLPSKLRKILRFLSTALVLAFAILIFVLSVNWITQPTISFQKSPIMEIPMIIPYLSVPVGLLFFSIHSFKLFADNFQKSHQTIELSETIESKQVKQTNTLANEGI